jgi:hypothetical protein
MIVITKETILADRSNVIVLIVDTASMFSVRKSEYSPKAYSIVIPALVRNLAGTNG